MSTKDNEINRTVDDTAEGHVKMPNLGEPEAGKKAAVRAASLDDDADGHRMRTIDEAEAAKKAALRTAALDDEADGHRMPI